MPAVASVRELRTAMNMRPLMNVPSPQWCVGPFDISGTIANGAVTDDDLTVHDSWYSDEQVRDAYSLTNGSSTKIKAALHLEAVEFLFTTGTFAALAAATKDNLFADTTGPYLHIKVGGVSRKIGMLGHSRQLVRIAYSALAAGAQAEVAELANSAPYKLPSPVLIDLENDTFSLKSDADTALGAAEEVRIRLHGLIIPGTQGIPGALPGGSCGQAVDGDRGAGAVAALAQLNRINATTVLKPF